MPQPCFADSLDLFGVEETIHGPLTRLAIRGDLDRAAVPALQRALDRAARPPGRTITLDLDRLAFIDAAGLHLLVRWSAQAAAGGCELRIVNPSPQLRRLLTLTGLGRALPVSREPLAADERHLRLLPTRPAWRRAG